MNDVRAIEIPEHYTLTVTLTGPPARAVVVEGRVAKLIAWLITHRARIERTGVGSLVFNMGLNSFQPELHEHFPRQQASPEPVPGETDLLSTAG